MQINILEIAQKLIDELGVEEQAMRHRAEGVAMLFRKIQEAHAEANKPAETVTPAAEQPDVEG